MTALLALVFLMTLKPALIPVLLGLTLVFGVGFVVAYRPGLGRPDASQVRPS